MSKNSKLRHRILEESLNDLSLQTKLNTKTSEFKLLDYSSDEFENDNKAISFSESWFKNNSKIIWFSYYQLVFSRIFILTFQFFINHILRDYPTDAFRGIPPKNLSPSDHVVNFFFGGLSCWDARHFLHTAEFGYTWESCLAFFPLFPAVLRIFGTFIQTLIGPISLFYSMVLGGVIINNTIFVVNGLLLFRLVFILTQSLKEALISVYIFCWNPASIFFSTVYSETLYFFFTLLALLVLFQGPHKIVNQIISSFVFSFAFLTRSNGITNFGYVGFYLMLSVILKKLKSNGKFVFEDFDLNLKYKVLKATLLLVLCFCIMIAPLRLFGFAMEEKFCTTKALYQDQRLLSYIEDNKSLVFPGELKNLTWCNKNQLSLLIMPPYYFEVQEKYWSVGFMKYWQFRKIPFFILATPSLAFVFYGVSNIVTSIMNKSDNKFEEMLIDCRLLIPFAVQSLFLALSGIFMYNVEVSMRMIFSASPFIYIVIARIISDQTPRVIVPDDLLEPYLLPFLSIYARVRFLHFVMLSYLLSFFFIGTTFHVNWLPFL